jgi:hypothetical protein
MRLGPLIGLAFFVAGLSRYRSYSDRVVFGLWSYSFFLLFVAACALLALAAANSLRASVRGADNAPTPAACLLDLGLLCWGAAYFLSAIDSPAMAGRVLAMNFFGSLFPPAAALEWFALVLFFLAGAFAVSQLGGKWIKLGLVVGSILFLALLAEGFARVKAVVAPETQGFPTYSTELWMRRYVKLNPEGFRDAPHAPVATPGTRRLLLVGDSVAFGSGIVRSEERLGEQLVERLRASTGQKWELLNASRPDTNTLDHIGFLERMVSYHPVVVALLYVFNDIDYLEPAVDEGRLMGRASESSRFDPLRICFQNFYAFQEVLVRVRFAYYSMHGDTRPDPYLNPALLARHFVDLVRFQSIATRDGALFELIPINLESLLAPKLRDRYRLFLQQASAAGLPTCSLEGAFDGSSFRDLTVNVMDNHANERANRLAADVVAGCLAQRPEG